MRVYRDIEGHLCFLAVSRGLGSKRKRERAGGGPSFL